MKSLKNMPLDDRILNLMAKGMGQKEISEHLKELGIKPNSLSIIEKELKEIRAHLKAKTNFHLAVILIRKGYKF